jgi:hypothetical protein
MRTVQRLVVLLTFGCLGVGGGGIAAAQAAEPVWSATQTVTATGINSDTPQVALDAAGNGVAVWHESDGSANRIKAAYRPAGGFLQPASVVELSAGDTTSSEPHVAMSPNGTAIAVWISLQAGSTTHYQVLARVRPPGAASAWGPRTSLIGGTESASAPAVAIDANGNAIVAFVRSDPLLESGRNTTRLQYVLRPANGTFTGTNSIYYAGSTGADEGLIGRPDVTFDAQGNALLAWASAPTSYNQDRNLREIHAAQKPAGGAFEAPQTLPAVRGTDLSFSNVHASLYDGRAIVTWDRTVGAAKGTAEYAYRATGAGTAWPSTAQVLAGDRNTAGAYGFVDDVTFDPQGNVIAYATLATNYVESLREAVIPAGGTTFGALKPVAAGLPGKFPQMGIDGAGVITIAWGVDDGTTVHLYVARRGAGAAGTFGAPAEQAQIDQDGVLGVGPGGSLALMWSTNDGANLVVQARFADPPPNVVPPAPGAPTPPVTTTPLPEVVPPPPPAPPVPSAIQLATPFASGKAAVLTVAVSGRVDRLEWNVGGRQTVTGRVVNGVLQRSIRLRLTGNPNIQVTAIGPGGTTTYSRAFATPRAPGDDDAKKVRAGESNRTPGTIAAGTQETLLGQNGCGPVTLYEGGAREVAGCFTPVDELEDIPANARGVLSTLAEHYKLDGGDAALMRRAVQLTDGYVGTGTAVIDGLWPVVPAGGAKLVLLSQAEAMVSANAGVRVAGQLLGPAGSGFNLHLDASPGFISLGAVRRPAGLSGLGGFAYSGDFDVALGPAFAQIQTNVKLPSFITRNGVNIVPRIQVYASPDAIVGADGLTIGPMNVDFGVIPVRGLKVSYRGAGDQWEGSGSACVFGIGCLDFVQPLGGLRFANGQLVYAKAAVDFGSPGRPLAPGVFLENAGLGFGLDPSRLFGSARISVGSFVKLDGHEVFAFPSAAAPYRLRHDEVGDAFPAAMYDTPYTRPLIAAGADLSLALPVIGETRLGGGYFLYEMPGYIAMGGSTDLNVLGIVRFSGGVSGEFDIVKQRYNLHGDIRACLIAVDDDLCAGAVANISRGQGTEGGAGACLDVGPVSVGGGIKWARPNIPIIWPLDGCKWSRFKIDVRAAAVAAQAGGGVDVEVKQDAPSQAIRLDGSGAAPRVRVTGPGGVALESEDDGLAYTADGKVRIVRFDNADAHFTTVGLQGAAAGRWHIEALPGSTITGTSRATDPADAKVSGAVEGKGAVRTLSYNVLARPAQRVTFSDVAPGGARKAITTIAGGGTGRVRFTPAPGRGRHRVVASFTLDDIAAEERTVARFTPPSPVLATPAGLKVRRAGSGLVVSWTGVPDAKRYEVTVTTSDGAQKFLTVRTRTARFTRIAKTATGTITVRATATLRASRTARTKLPRAAKAKSGGLQKLGRCSVRKKKVTCGGGK